MRRGDFIGLIHQFGSRCRVARDIGTDVTNLGEVYETHVLATAAAPGDEVRPAT